MPEITQKTVLLLDTSQTSSRHILSILEDIEDIEVIHEGSDYNKYLSMIRSTNPDIVILNFYPSIEESVQLAKQITSMFPDVALIAAADTMNPAIILNVMRARAHEFLKQPVIKEELTGVIHRIFREKEAVNLLKNTDSKIITLFGSKGGAGTTTIASNMAVSLAKHTQKDIILVDLDLQFGDAALHMNVKSKYSIVDIISNLDQVDMTLLKSLLPKGNNGISVLSVPPNLEDAENIKPVHIEKLLMLLRKVFDYIIVDTHHGLDDITIKAMDESNYVLVVSTLDIPSIFHTKRCLQLFQKMTYDMDKLFLVINRHNGSDDFDANAIERMLGYPVFWSIPEHDMKNMVTAINRGDPIASMMPDIKLSQNLMDMSVKFNGAYKKEKEEETPSRKKGSLFSFMKSMK
ncbi:AAA family ATPase [bacterium]|nr:AAA family ATPase [bacterium]